jgi:predicted nucleic-acid-binding Zn-ribbon protein
MVRFSFFGNIFTIQIQRAIKYACSNQGYSENTSVVLTFISNYMAQFRFYRCEEYLKYIL